MFFCQKLGNPFENIRELKSHESSCNNSADIRLVKTRLSNLYLSFACNIVMHFSHVVFFTPYKGHFYQNISTDVLLHSDGTN